MERENAREKFRNNFSKMKSLFSEGTSIKHRQTFTWFFLKIKFSTMCNKRFSLMETNCFKEQVAARVLSSFGF